MTPEELAAFDKRLMAFEQRIDEAANNRIRRELGLGEATKDVERSETT